MSPIRPMLQPNEGSASDMCRLAVRRTARDAELKRKSPGFTEALSPRSPHHLPFRNDGPPVLRTERLKIAQKSALEREH
jgi:hypothetical protein